MRGWLSAASILASRSNRPTRSSSEAKLVEDHFDGDRSSELRVVRAIDLAHPAGAKGGDDLVRAEASSD